MQNAQKPGSWKNASGHAHLTRARKILVERRAHRDFCWGRVNTLRSRL